MRSLTTALLALLSMLCAPAGAASVARPASGFPEQVTVEVADVIQTGKDSPVRTDTQVPPGELRRLQLVHGKHIYEVSQERRER